MRERSAGLVWALPLLLVGALVYALANGESGLRPWFRLRAELVDAHSRIDALARENAALQAQVDALGSDPFAVERAIREDLELARAGEVVVLFDPAPASEGALQPVSSARFP